MTIARLVYYGELVPNTYVLKMTGVPLSTRLARGLTTDLKLLPLLLLATAGAVVIWKVADADSRRILVLLGAVGVGAVAYSTWVGGDAWEDFPNRYVAVTLVVGSIIAVTGIEVWAHATRPNLRMASVVVAGVIVLFGASSLGMVDDVVSYSKVRALFAVAGFAVLSAVVLGVMVLRRNSPRAPAALMVLGVVAVLFASSGFSGLLWILAQRGNGTAKEILAMEPDQDETDLGLALGSIVLPGGTIAVEWAGAPVYYSDRAAIDLLGKNDPVIAREAPKGYFRPGHDKFDFDHSIFDLRPDVVAQLPGDRTQIDEERLRTERYQRLCLRTASAVVGIWVLDTSPFVDLASPLLGPCD
jgi:type IV secretory pathway VirB2 component (pilin)